jgi:hypothetical protein
MRRQQEISASGESRRLTQSRWKDEAHDLTWSAITLGIPENIESSARMQRYPVGLRPGCARAGCLGRAS